MLQLSPKLLYAHQQKIKRGYRRSTILKLANFFNSEKLRQIAHPDLFFFGQ
jgi:hypothetical protein